ncbi:hypothetical protein LINPERPRIM_LOCUS6297 [Linum perenne]
MASSSSPCKSKLCLPNFLHCLPLPLYLSIESSSISIAVTNSSVVDKCPYFPGQEPTLPGHIDFLLQDGYRAVRFNPYLWPSGEKMTNEARELGVHVGFMCMKGLSLHISEIKKLCTNFSSTPVLIDHLSFCEPPTLCRNDEEKATFFNLLNLSRFPRYPYDDSSHLLSKVVSSFVANQCGYNGAKEAVNLIASRVELSETEKEWVMGKTIMHVFQSQ